MKASFVAALLLVVAVQGFNMEVSMTSSLSFDAEAAKNRPVSKVITLLKDMLKQLEKEAEEDEEIYDSILDVVAHVFNVLVFSVPLRSRICA